MTHQGAGGRGRFITLEGGEGGGKSTQCRLLAAMVKASRALTPWRQGSREDHRVLSAFANCWSPASADRWTPLTEVLLHYAARQDHIRAVIEPALAAGQWVVCDRFFNSTLAYQGYGHGVPLNFIETLRQQIVGDTVSARSHRNPGSTGSGGAAPIRMLGSTPSAGMNQCPSNFTSGLRRGFQEIAKREPKRCVVHRRKPAGRRGASSDTVSNR